MDATAGDRFRNRRDVFPPPIVATAFLVGQNSALSSKARVERLAVTRGASSRNLGE